MSVPVEVVIYVRKNPNLYKTSKENIDRLPEMLAELLDVFPEDISVRFEEVFG